jgi:hypothetical protein
LNAATAAIPATSAAIRILRFEAAIAGSLPAGREVFVKAL